MSCSSPTLKLIRGLCALGLLAIVAALQPSQAQEAGSEIASRFVGLAGSLIHTGDGVFL